MLLLTTSQYKDSVFNVCQSALTTPPSNYTGIKENASLTVLLASMVILLTSCAFRTATLLLVRSIPSRILQVECLYVSTIVLHPIISEITLLSLVFYLALPLLLHDTVS